MTYKKPGFLLRGNSVFKRNYHFSKKDKTDGTDEKEAENTDEK